MGIKDVLLNKGWAGTTMSRQETIERINPLIRRHIELNHAYVNAINRVSERDVAGELEALQKTARADVGKLSETVLSAGGVSYNGVDLEPGDFASSDDLDEGKMIHQLQDREGEFQQLVTDEMEENHQIRTRAILSIVQANSLARIDYLRGPAKKHRRTS